MQTQIPSRSAASSATESTPTPTRAITRKVDAVLKKQLGYQGIVISARARVRPRKARLSTRAEPSIGRATNVPAGSSR